MTRAPTWPSSPGWNMNSTAPASSSRRRGEQPRRAGQHGDVRVVAAGVHRARRSRDAKSRPVSSGIGSASMSPRSRMVGPGRPPRSVATTASSACRARPRGRARRARRAPPRCVRGRSRPSSGCAWRRRRSVTASGRKVLASSMQPARVAHARIILRSARAGNQRPRRAARHRGPARFRRTWPPGRGSRSAHGSAIPGGGGGGGPSSLALRSSIRNMRAHALVTNTNPHLGCIPVPGLGHQGRDTQTTGHSYNLDSATEPDKAANFRCLLVNAQHHQVLINNSLASHSSVFFGAPALGSCCC